MLDLPASVREAVDGATDRLLAAVEQTNGKIDLLVPRIDERADGVESRIDRLDGRQIIVRPLRHDRRAPRRHRGPRHQPDRSDRLPPVRAGRARGEDRRAPGVRGRARRQAARHPQLGDVHKNVGALIDVQTDGQGRALRLPGAARRPDRGRPRPAGRHAPRPARPRPARRGPRGDRGARPQRPHPPSRRPRGDHAGPRRGAAPVPPVPTRTDHRHRSPAATKRARAELRRSRGAPPSSSGCQAVRPRQAPATRGVLRVSSGRQAIRRAGITRGRWSRLGDAGSIRGRWSRLGDPGITRGRW